jgi:hypothetical protein
MNKTKPKKILFYLLTIVLSGVFGYLGYHVGGYIGAVFGGALGCVLGRLLDYYI